MVKYFRCLNSIHNDQISAGIHPSYRNGLFSLSSLERRAIIRKHIFTIQIPFDNFRFQYEWWSGHGRISSIKLRPKRCNHVHESFFRGGWRLCPEHSWTGWQSTLLRFLFPARFSIPHRISLRQRQLHSRFSTEVLDQTSMVK